VAKSSASSSRRSWASTSRKYIPVGSTDPSIDASLGPRGGGWKDAFIGSGEDCINGIDDVVAVAVAVAVVAGREVLRCCCAIEEIVCEG